MENLQSELDRAVEQGELPFVVATVANRDGVVFEGSAGSAANGRDAGMDTMFRIFSMTKAIGSTAAAILVDRGKLDPGEPVGNILPEWKELRVLEGLGDSGPILREPATEATVRHLATHTSGLEYEFWNADVAAYMEATEHPSVLAGTKSSLNYPLMTDPGTRWGYGPSTDWLGRVVEAVDGRRIDSFCTEEIFEPLGMTDTVFELSEAQTARLADVSIRGEDGTFGPMEIAPPPNPEVYGMGHALYSAPKDYIRFCQMVLNNGMHGGKQILGPAAMSLMMEDQMGGLSFEKMTSSSPLVSNVDMFGGAPTGHTFGFLQNRADVPGRRRAGSLGWAGVLNSHYWIDPSTGIAAVFMTQSLPFVEKPLLDFYGRFETAVHQQAS
ncbi:serine hydrolase domain-containing protein [Hoeflea prorocentri]|uniref:Serine hydrolase n=1 Tax=Hoeflea prorocentri TaxID=1922333 RepID=A0A9X3UMN9_9HYPH|nr:serine hydrolase domain-containing protein [Hoeflea prorocentri]MCY6383497.1 serine hydrolase [Hoeflea prorocentri]MDA5401297.1 serine hydrolase [Hoeflea prorocentri]